jgi:tripartite-type tricarboxylate transporter receptor subunit TctC
VLRRLLFPFVLMLTLTVLVAACGEPAAQPTPAPAPKAPAAQPTPAPAAPAAATPAPAAQPTPAPAAPAATPAAATPAAALPPPPVAATPPAAVTAPPPRPKPTLTSGWPQRTVTFIIAFNAGGSSDVGARIVTGLLEREFGGTYQVVNRPGAGGQIGWTELARSRADGYTIGGINLPHLPAVVVDQSRQAVFGKDDLVPVATQAVDPTVISVHANSQWQTLDDLVRELRARPGQLTAGIVGILNDDEIGYLQFADAANVEMRPVRFDGAAPAITALLGNHVDVLFCTVGDNYVQAQAGNIRVLGTMSVERVTEFFPDVPTMEELGHPGIISSSTRGFAVPNGVPENILADIEAALLYVMSLPEHVDQMVAAGQPAVIVGRDEIADMYDLAFEQIETWIDRRIKDK